MRHDRSSQNNVFGGTRIVTWLVTLLVLLAVRPAFSGAIYSPARGIHLPNRAMTSDMIAAACSMDPRMVVVICHGDREWGIDSWNMVEYLAGHSFEGNPGINTSAEIFVRLAPTTCPLASDVGGRNYANPEHHVLELSAAAVVDRIVQQYRRYAGNVLLTRWIPGNEPCLEWGSGDLNDHIWNYTKWQDIGKYYSDIWDELQARKLVEPDLAPIELYTPAFTPFACVGVSNYYPDGSVARKGLSGLWITAPPSDNYNLYPVGYNVPNIYTMIDEKYKKVTWHDYWFPGKSSTQLTYQWFPPWLRKALKPSAQGGDGYPSRITEAGWLPNALDLWPDWDRLIVNKWGAGPDPSEWWIGYYEDDLRHVINPDVCHAGGVAVWLLAAAQSDTDDFYEMGGMVCTNPDPQNEQWQKRDWFDGYIDLLNGVPMPREDLVAGHTASSSGDNLGGVLVVATGTNGATYQATSDGNGSYLIRNTPSGYYSVRATKSGYEPQELGVTVGGGGNAIALFTLQPNGTTGNTLVNNDFETANQVGWNRFGNTATIGVSGTGYYNMPSASGTYFLQRARNGAFASRIIGGVYQTATTTPGLSHSASVWLYTRRDNGGSIMMGNSLDARGRIGVDPTGGTDPNSGSVVWSYWTESQAAWRYLSTPQFTSGNLATIFLQYDLVDGSSADWLLAAFDQVEMADPTGLAIEFGNIYVDGFNGSTAVVHWTTDSPTSGSACVTAATDGEAQACASDPAGPSTNHTATVPMSANTTYQLWVKAWQSGSDTVVSEVQNYTTPDLLQVPISNISWTHVASGAPYGYVRITWNTPNVWSGGGIEWGTAMSYGQYTATIYGPGYTHEARIADFTPGTTYHFRVKATASGYATTYSGDYTFNVPKVPVPMDNWSVGSVTTNSAVVHWETPAVASTSRVDYGTTTNYGQNRYVATPTEQHTITLTGLSPGTTYHCKAKSTATNYNAGVTPDMVFTTLLPMTISNIYVDNVTQTSATVHWTTNVSSTSRVYYRVQGTTPWSTLYNSSLLSGHAMTLPSLSAGTPYQYYVKSTRSGYQDATSGIQTFTTAASTGTLTGTVKYRCWDDSIGKWMTYNLGNASVTVAGRSTVSAVGTGSYSIQGIPPGTYQATCSHALFGTTTANVTIVISQTTTKNWLFTMEGGCLMVMPDDGGV